MNDELKKCPFCGGEAELSHTYEAGKFSFVICVQCGVRIRLIPISYEYSSDKEAIKAWNERVNYENIK